MSSLRAPDKMARTKSNTQNDTKTRTTSWRNRRLEKPYFCVFRIFIFLFFIYNFLNEFSKKCCVTALVRSMTFIWEFKPVLSYSKPHTFSISFGEEKEWKKCIYSLQPVHLETEQNDRKVKRSKIKQKWVKKRILSTNVFCLWKPSQVCLWKSSQVRGRMANARNK